MTNEPVYHFEMKAVCRRAGHPTFATDAPEAHHEALGTLVRQVEGRLLAAELTVALAQTVPAAIDLTAAKALARQARDAITRGQLGYCLILATRQATR